MNRFLRMLAVFYFIGAVLHLLDVLGLRLDFSNMSFGWKIWIIFLLVGDAIASFGLWRYKKYGEYLFLLISFSQLIAYGCFEDFFGDQTVLIVFHFVCLVAYLFFKLNKRGSRQRLTQNPAIIDKAMKRVLVLGCSGGGKSTLSRRLGKVLGIPVVHLEVHSWQPNWTQPESEQWRTKIKSLAKAEKWVMDGTFSESFDLRFSMANKIIILDIPRLICLWRAVIRLFKYNRIKKRPDMAEGCDESFSLDFYIYIYIATTKRFSKKSFQQ